MTTRTISKTIDRTFLLRVSSKGDDKGNENQLEVPADFVHLADVVDFLEVFDVRMMKASNTVGTKLRAKWQRERGLKVLTRAGRQDFLGVSVVVGRSRFIVYASTAGQMDEARGNAFTRHVCEAIADPAFSGTADPEFVARRDSGFYNDLEHPSLVHAFDPTRFCRSVSAATQMYDEAERNMAAFEARDLQIDPAQGSHMKIMWVFLAYGSEMEAVVGKQRRLVGRLNAARNGLWPYRPGMTPLGVVAPGNKGKRRLQVDKTHVASVARLALLGLDPRNSDARILRDLGSEPYNVASTHPSTFGKPVYELHSSAVRRLYLRRKLEAYRDGELALEFVGVADNQLRLGSGHILKRRWEGHDESGQPDRLGSVTYRIDMPKPTVTGRDGSKRRGWLEGLTDEEERSVWNRLIALRGTDEQGRRSLDELGQEALDDNPDLDDSDRARLAVERERAQQRLRGGRQGDRVISAICPPYRLPHDDEAGPRHYLRHRSSLSQICELHLESATPENPQGGVLRDSSLHLATFNERELTAGLAALVTAAVRHVTDEGPAVAAHDVRISPALQKLVGKADPSAEREEALGKLLGEDADARAEARGYDKLLATEMGQPIPDNDRVKDLEEQAVEARRRHQELTRRIAVLQAAPLPLAHLELPALNGADPRDLVVGLLGPYGSGTVPEAFLDAVATFLPAGVTFQSGPDDLELEMVADICLNTEDGEQVTVVGLTTPIANHLGRGAGGQGAERAALMAVRFLCDGVTLEKAARSAGILDLTYARGLVEDRLNVLGKMPDSAMRLLAAQCEVPETRAALHAFATTDSDTPRDGFERHLVALYGAAVPRGRHPHGTGRGWAYELNLDSRLDQLTVLREAKDPGRGLVAAALGCWLNPVDARLGLRHVQDASTVRRRRLPAPGFPDGWHGVASGNLLPEDKRVALALCPYDDCSQPYADVLCPVAEVVALGAMLLCRHCLRAATPKGHPQHAAARRGRFPAGYVTWADSQAARSGEPVRCAAGGCTVDVGFGAGMTWQWLDDRGKNAWHSATCRVGAPTQQYRTCQFADCVIDQGGGPGAVLQTSRTARMWHSRACEHAERRRQRADTVRYSTCRWALCTRDDGDGPGSIASTDKRRRVVHDNDECRQGDRRNPRST